MSLAHARSLLVKDTKLVFPSIASQTTLPTRARLGESVGGLSRYIAGLIDEDDIVVDVSASGGTGSVYDDLAKGKERGATTVAVTENSDTPLGR